MPEITVEVVREIIVQNCFMCVFFKDMECTEFSHARDWGVGIGDSEFTSPSTNNFAPYFKDLQYFELENSNEKSTDLYCEGDVVSHIEYDEAAYYEVMFDRGKFLLNAGRRCKSMEADMLTFCKREGNIFENPNLVE